MPTATTVTEQKLAAALSGSRPTPTRTATPPAASAPKGVTANWEVITPEEAQAILDTANTANRKIRAPYVDALARDMVNGDWMASGDPIRFDNTGRLIDGQHRLSAVVLSGKAAPFLVIRGFAPEVQDVIDSGIARTVGDTLTFSGLSNKYNVAAVARLAIHRDDGYHRYTRDTRSKRRLTHAEVIHWLDAHPEITELAGPAISTSRAISARPSAAWVYGSWVLNGVDDAAYHEFNDSLYNAATEGAGDPRATLMQYLRKHDLNALAFGGKGSTPGPLLYAMFRVWNAWRDGEQLTRLVPSGKVPARGAVIPDPH